MGRVRLGLWITAGVAAVALVVLAAGALGNGQTEERIEDQLPASLRRAPSRCVSLDTKVSHDHRFALVTPTYSTGESCARYASDGVVILRRVRSSNGATGTDWTVVFQGSDPPPCSLGVPSQLTACLADGQS